MPRPSPIQESFSSGEISKNVRGRVSTDVYKKALKFCENWTPQVQGSLRMRDGFQYRDDIDPRNSVARLFTFSVGLDQDFIVEVGDAFVIVRDGITGLQATGGQSTNLVTDPTYQSEQTFWTFDNNFYTLGTPPTPGVITWQHAEDSFTEQNITNPDFTIVVFFPEGSVGGELRQNIIVPAGTDILTHNFSISYLLTMTDCDKGDMGAPSMADAEIVIRVGTTETGAEIAEDITAILDVGSGTISFGFVPGAAVTDYWIGIGVRWNGTGIPPVDPTACGELIDTFNYKFGPASVTTALPGGSGTPVEFASPYSAEDLICMHSAMDPGESELWLTVNTNNVEQYRLKFDGVVWTFLDITSVPGFLFPSPVTWAAGSWPSKCAFRHGRLWFGNIPSQRATIWGSRAGDYVDFNGSAPVNADDPLLFPLSVAGIITALSNKKQLVVNTDVSEVVGESTLAGNVIIFNDFGFPLQTEWGSSCVQPVGVGRELIYVSPSGKKLRTFSDEGGTNYGWDGFELNLLAQDLFGSRIVELCWADDPAYQLMCVMGDGSIVAATYYQEEKVIGFYRLTTNGLIKSITVTNTIRGATVWALVERSGTWRLEELPFNSGCRHALDSWVFEDVGSAGVITGLDHLDGQECHVVVQSVDPNTGTTYWAVQNGVFTPVAGSITLTNPSSFNQQAYVGLIYDNSWQVLDLEGTSVRGTSQSSKRRWNKVFLRLADSAIPLVEGVPTKDRTPSTPMGLGEPFKTGDVEVVDLGSGAGDIVISQDKPLISEVSAIFGKVTSTEV